MAVGVQQMVKKTKGIDCGRASMERGNIIPSILGNNPKAVRSNLNFKLYHRRRRPFHKGQVLWPIISHHDVS